LLEGGLKTIGENANIGLHTVEKLCLLLFQKKPILK
jgi:hypothetical protein